MKKIYTFMAVLLVTAIFSTASAQDDKCGVSIHLGGILPMGQFSESPSYVAPAATFANFGSRGAAMFGASLGLRYNYTFVNTHWEDSGFGIFAAADLMWNALNKETRQKYDDMKCTKPMYVNVPIMLGGTWTSDFLRSPVNMWVEVGLGCDLFKKTSEGWSDNLTSYKLNTEFACEGGVGIIVKRLFSIGVHYYWLGKHEVKTENGNYGDGFHAAPTMALHTMAFKVGFHF